MWGETMQKSYDGVAKTLHWLIMILVLPMLYYGFNAHNMPKEDRLGFFELHSGIGIIILLLMLTRFIWRLAHPVPPLPDDLPQWQRIASKASHHGLYFLIIMQPIFGLLLTSTSKFNLKAFGIFGLQVSPNDTIHHLFETLHGLNAWVITALIALHVLAALYHHFIRKDIVLKRMLPFTKV
jgi:cytochrome b561